jgi:arsenate reductase-like glutaredoxin family protein
MLNLEELFSIGEVTKLVEISSKKGEKAQFRIRLLDSANLQKALNAAADTQKDEIAYALELKKQIIARALVGANGQNTFVDEKNPSPDELNNNLQFLGKVHFSLINKIYDEYEKMDNEISNEMDDELKK